MTPSSGFLDQLSELFSPLGEITWRKMFGGAGLYCDGRVFAIVDDERIFFKADPQNELWYTTRGSEKFTFDMGGKVGTMNYWSGPEELLDDQHVALEYAHQAIQAARRAPAPSPKKPRKKG